MGCLPQITAETTAVRAELARADAKCGTLAALATAAAALLATQLTRATPTTARVLLGAAGVVLALAALVLLARVIRPRLGGTGWRHWATTDPATILATLSRAESAEAAAARDLHNLAQICTAKYRALRHAVDLAALGVLLIAAGTLAAALA
ncbi:Pycsar system effector family protein [Actinomadura nitritigenes]|uniref:Pycsar system effector family protein n=1 Tax=Actinomadura nitritigenes TaxID=134602 RepID=UPI00368A8077